MQGSATIVRPYSVCNDFRVLVGGKEHASFFDTATEELPPLVGAAPKKVTRLDQKWTTNSSTRTEFPHHWRWTSCADGHVQTGGTTPSSSLGSIETSRNQRDRQHNWSEMASFEYCPPRPPHLTEESSNEATGNRFTTRTRNIYSPARFPLPSTTCSFASTGMGDSSPEPRSLLQSTPLTVAGHGCCPCLSIDIVFPEAKTAAIFSRSKRCVGYSAHCGGSTEELRNAGGERESEDRVDPNNEGRNDGGAWLDLHLDDFLRATEKIAAASKTTVREISTPVALSRLCLAFPEVRLNLGVLDKSSQEPVIAAYIAGLDRLDRCRRRARFTSSDSVESRPPNPTNIVAPTANNDTQITDYHHHQGTRPAKAKSPRGATYSPLTCGFRAPVAPKSARPSTLCGNPPNVHPHNIYPPLSALNLRLPQPVEPREECSELQPSSPRSARFNKRRLMMSTSAGHPTPPSFVVAHNCNHLKTRGKSTAYTAPNASTTALQGARPDAGAEAAAMGRGSRRTPFRPGIDQGRGTRCCVSAHLPVYPGALPLSSLAAENEGELSIVGRGQGGEHQRVRGKGDADGDTINMTEAMRRTKGVGYDNETGGTVSFAQRKAAMFLTRHHRRVSAGVAPPALT